MGLPPRPASAGHSQMNGRKLAFADRIVGTVEEWGGNWGWIVPLQHVTHPLFRGKLYAHRRDVKCNPSYMGAGSTVDFLLYADSRGLGAGDIREADASAVPAGQEEEVDAAKDKLPPGWEKHWSDEHGEFYYWNKSTKETSWVPPEAPDEDEADEDDDNDDLPDGWSENFDPETNATYFWHAPSKTTTWERPRRPRKKEAPADHDDEENEDPPETEEAVRQPNADEPVLGQQRVKGRVDKWQGFFGWISPMQELSADLKPLLENRDAIYCNWRDVEAGVTLKAGSLVDFLLYADDNGLGASSVRLQKEDGEAPAAVVTKKGTKRLPYQKDDMLELERQWKKQDAELAEGADEATEEQIAAEPAEGVVDAIELEDAPLLPGWEQVWSEESSCFYYWHRKTKMSSWERPCVPSGLKKTKEKVWEGEGAEEGAARLATPITPVGKTQAGQDITPLTPGGEDAAAKAKANEKQPSAAFRAAQASGAFRGRGWQGGATNGNKGHQEQALPNPFVKRQAPSSWQQPAGKGGWMAVKRQRG